MIRKATLFLGAFFFVFAYIMATPLVESSSVVPGCAEPEDFLTEGVNDSTLVVHWAIMLLLDRYMICQMSMTAFIPKTIG